MRRTFLTAVLAGTATFCAVISEAETETADAAAIARVIGDQIEAFKSDDFATAFTYASPGIRGIFGSPERFGQMVRQGYPMVWRPSQVEFLDLREQGGALIQEVLVRDAAGVDWLLDYEMVRGGTGWQINGVQIRDAPRLGA